VTARVGRPTPDRAGSGSGPGPTTPPRAAGGIPWSRLVLIWLLGVSLRVGMLSLPPLLPEIHRRLGLGPLVLGTLTTAPTLLLAVAALAGSAVVARLGAPRAVAVGLAVAALAGALRGAGPSTAALVMGSLVLGVGVAVAQPGLPALAGRWWPARVSLATAVYTNGIIVGEAVAAGLTLPVVLSWAGGWQAALAVWSLPVLVAAGAVFALDGRQAVRRSPRALERRPAGHWWPEWERPETWLVGVVQGAGSIAYFGANAYLPTAFGASGRGGLVAVGLTVLNVAQLPASFLVGWVARHHLRPTPLLVGAGVAVSVGAAGLAFGPGAAGVVGAALVGGGSAVGFVVALALPPLLVAPSEVATLSAAMFTVGYLLAFVVPLLGGAAWAGTGFPALAFGPVALGGIGLIVVARLRRVRALEEARVAD